MIKITGIADMIETKINDLYAYRKSCFFCLEKDH